MVSLNVLAAALALPTLSEDVTLLSLDDAQVHLSGVPLARLRPAFMRLLAEALLPNLNGLNALVQDLERLVSRPQSERAIVRWLAEITGGQATILSSWGDIVAQQGQAEGVLMAQALNYEGRAVGQLKLEAQAHWEPLLVLVTAQARQARLQSATAGAARRRVSERQFEALLSGDTSGQDNKACVLAALRLDQPMPRAEREREAYVRRLDTLCSAGEGYFHGRDLLCLTNVRGDKALWLWHSQHPQQEAHGLHQALLNSTPEPLRLGISSLQSSFEAAAALGQALQALEEVRTPREMALFQRMDALQMVLHSTALEPLAEQLRGALRAEDTDGKLEDTLRHYLNHRGSLGDLAASLNLHVNTLRYRLRRSEEILGGNLSEAAFVTRLYLALHAQGGAHK